MRARPEHADCGLQLLRLALARHRVLPDALDDEAFDALLAKARQARDLERRALAARSPQTGATALAHHVTTFDEALEPYTRDQALAAVGLDEAGLHEALARELAFDRLARDASAAIAPVSASEIARYYRDHTARFTLPERREARQILVTVNEVIAENRHDVARERIVALQRELSDAPQAFPALAAKHSECPSALHEGLLGVVSPGQLYPELDRALFGLAAGGVSDVLESPLGFHLLRCERILPPSRLDLDSVAPHIRRELTAARERQARRAWLDALESGLRDEQPGPSPGYAIQAAPA